jgi:peptidase E
MRWMTIIAMGGGGFSMEETPLLDDYVLAATHRPNPRVLFVPTASGDSADYVRRFYDALGGRCEPSHLELFRRDDRDLRAFVLAHDAIYVGGGNTANMLAIWRAHGLDQILRDALAAGLVLAGLSAGAVCWFEGTVTDSFGPLAALRDGLGLLPGVLVPHYDSETERRPALHRLLDAETFARAYAADDGAALVFRDRQLVEVVTSRPDAAAYRVERLGVEVTESRLAVRYLG